MVGVLLKVSFRTLAKQREHVSRTAAGRTSM